MRLALTAAVAVLPLNQVAKITEMEGPSTINREWGRRRITVQCNMAGRDVAGFVAEARQKIGALVKLPGGCTLEWGGQFENMERANQRLKFVVPMALALIFVLLYFSLKSLREVLIVASGIPLGLVGEVLALWLRGMPFTVSSAIGFIALSGVAILNGLVLVTFIKQKLDDGTPLPAAVREGCLVRLRPVLMTALVAAVGFIPMAVNVGGRRRDPTPARHRRHRRYRDKHRADTAGNSGALQSGWRPVQGRGTQGGRTPWQHRACLTLV